MLLSLLIRKSAMTTHISKSFSVVRISPYELCNRVCLCFHLFHLELFIATISSNTRTTWVHTYPENFIDKCASWSCFERMLSIIYLIWNRCSHMCYTLSRLSFLEMSNLTTVKPLLLPLVSIMASNRFVNRPGYGEVTTPCPVIALRGV